MTYVTEDETISDTDIDVAPETGDVEYPCQVCGRESGPYGGRGRKPTKCPEHKAQKTTSGPKVKGTQAALAAQAAEALVQLNGLLSMLCMLAGFFQTAMAINARADSFRDQAYNALLTDPDTCRQILRGGAVSGKVSLLLAYGMLAVSIAPVAVTEYKDKAVQRAADREES